MPVSLGEMEGMAWELLRRSDSCQFVRPRPLSVIARARIPVFFDADPRYAGWCDFPHGIHIAPDLRGEDLEYSIAHEGSHWWMCDSVISKDDQEAVVDQFMMCWRIPPFGVNDLVRQFGFSPPALLRRYRFASDVEVLTRAAMLRQVAVIIHSGAEGYHVVGPGAFEVNMVVPAKEQARMLGAAYRGDGPVAGAYQGIEAWPYRHRGRGGVAIVLDWEKLGLLELVA